MEKSSGEAVMLCIYARRHAFSGDRLLGCFVWTCRMVAPIIDELAKDYAGKIVSGELNVNENPKTAMRFDITSIPTLFIMKNGEEVDRIIGAVPKQS